MKMVQHLAFSEFTYKKKKKKKRERERERERERLLFRIYYKIDPT